jgi:hypothetical protein
LSHAIAEGDGISILVEVDGVDSARSADAQGADALVLGPEVLGIREASGLPLLLSGMGPVAPAAVSDAVIVDGDGDADELRRWFDAADEAELECVVRVSSAEALERALDVLDPEVLLLSGARGGEGDPLESLLDLLGDVPVGKLAIAELRDATTEDVAELERAGVDAVLVAGGDVAALVGDDPPAV